MIIIKSLDELIAKYHEGAVEVTVGNFDGVHIGHREFLSRILSDCKSTNSKFVVVTFVPHPAQIIKAQTGFLLNTFTERRELLAQCGVDYLLELDFTRDFSSLSPEDFFKKHIFVYPNIQKIFLGHDFSFGANKSGDYNLAKKLCEKENISLILQEEFRCDNESISSSIVRAEVLKGNIEKANIYLSRPYFLSGRVIKGQGRGKQIGFPTANLDYDRDLLIPQGGVYVTRTIILGMIYNSVTNIGINPTFNMDVEINVETHLLDFSRDIYGEEVRVIFLKKLRNEKKFTSVNELIDQINLDVRSTKDYFKND